MHENPELSWFETTGRIAGDIASVPAARSFLRPTLSRFLKQPSRGCSERGERIPQLHNRAAQRPRRDSPNKGSPHA